MTFEDLGLSPETLKAIADCGYTEPTPIQAASIPIVLMGRDLVGLAQTGTGKTASFTLPMIEILSGGRAKARMPRSLILTPTRELAAQIAENFDTYGKYHNLSKVLLVGGTSMNDQIKILERGADVLIATPGRLLDLFERGKILMTDIKVLVIDEADRMLDMGFIPDIEKIVSLLSPIRQTLLFSATMQPEIKKLTEQFLSNPREVSVTAPASTAANVEQFLVWTTRRNKREALLEIIKSEDVKNAFVFCNRKRDIADLTSWLKSKGYSVGQMHGDMDQKTRTETLQAFKNDEITLLVCSDVAARGLDVAGLSHVFNYDVPFNNDDYVHRIGRTGRAGLDGRAWSLASKGDDEKFVDAIEKLIKRSIPVKQVGGEKSQERSNDRANDRSNERKAEQKPRREKKDSLPRQKAEAPKQNKNQSKPSKKNDDDASYQKGFGDDVPAFFG
ncbi:MAG: DEAD/DEAH box helicase [Alphaproteobacteria bacterium]|nr:DEAD/DEAH box helicase [Alphaproteobacteria bacterium]